MFEKYHEKIYKALESAGEGGMTVGKVAREIKHSKSTTWNALQEMVARELIQRVENYDHTDYKQVKYFYYQLPLFPHDEVAGWECAWCEHFNAKEAGCCDHCGEDLYDVPIEVTHG